MMKFSLIVAFVFYTGLFCSAKGGEIEGFRTLKDEYDAKIPKGSYVLEGQIIHYASGAKLGKVEIQVVEGQKSYSTDGKFSITVPLNKTYVGFKKAKYQRSYFENYEIKDQHRIKIEVYMNKVGKTPQVSKEKPLVYAYSDRFMDFELKLHPKGALTFIYPVLDKENKWQMTLENDTMKDQSGTTFPYLFWEATEALGYQFKKVQGKLSGEVVAKQEVIQFLDSSLTYLKLNQQEKTDFITYWGPKLAASNYNFIQFVTQEDCDVFAAYEISPKPDVFNRLYVVYTAFENFPGFIRCEKQQLLPFFQLLEWGGMAYPKSHFDPEVN